MNKYILLPALVLALTACSSEENDIDQPVAARVSATIECGVASRASEASWSQNDEIGVSMGGRYLNIKYVTESGDGNFEGSSMFFRNKRESVDFTAYYPFLGTEGSAPGKDGLIEANTRALNQAKNTQPSIDFLFDSKNDVIGEHPVVKFEFIHKMSQLTFVFKNGTGADVKKIAYYTIEGLVLDGTFNTANGVCAIKDDGTPENLSIDLTDVEVVSGEAIPSLIVFPQTTADKNVTLKITDTEGQEYSCILSFDNDSIVAGNNYKWTITVNKAVLSIDKSEIIDWTTTEKEIDAGSVLPQI